MWSVLPFRYRPPPPSCHSRGSRHSQSVSRSVSRLFVLWFGRSFVRPFGLSSRSLGPFVRWFVRSIGRLAGRASQPASHWSFGKVGLSVCQSDCFGSFVRVVRSLVCSFGRSVGWSSQPASQPLVVRSGRSVDLSVGLTTV